MGDHNGLMGNHQGSDSYSLATGTNEGYKYQPDMDSDRRFPAGVLGHHYMANPPVEIMDIPRDRATSPEGKKKLKLIGSVAASLALTFALVGTACSKLNAGAVRVNKRPVPAEQSANAPTDSSDVVATEPKQEADPNMNTETADSEHDGKISYKIYEYDFTRGYDNYIFVGDRTSQVEYSDSDTVNDRKEASMDDFIECISKQGDSTTRCNSIDEVFAKEEDYHGANAFVDLLKKYGGYNNGDITKLEKHDYIIDQKGVYMRNICDYHFEELASVNPAITDGVLRIYVANSNADGSKNPYNQYGYGGKFTIDITNLYVSPDHKRPRNGGLIAHNFNSGRIVCDQMPTEKELIQIIKDNYDSIFKVDNHPNNRGALEGVMKDRRKP